MSQKPSPAKEYRDICDIVAKYVEALRIGSVDMMAGIFHKSAVTYGTVNGELMGGAGNPAVDFIKDHGKSPEIDSHVDVLDITPTTAAVRLVTENDAIGSDCTEYLTFLKLDNGWTVIAKIFHQFDK